MARRKRKHKGGPRPHLEPAQVRLARRRYRAGATCASLAREAGVSQSVMWSALVGITFRYVPGACERRSGGVARRRLHRGGGAEAIRRLRLEGHTVSSVAARFGVSRISVFQFLKRVRAGEPA